MTILSILDQRNQLQFSPGVNHSNGSCPILGGIGLADKRRQVIH